MRFVPMTMTMTMVNVVAMCCFVLVCAEDMTAGEDYTSAAEAMLSRNKREQENLCRLNQRCKEKIKKFASAAVQEGLKSYNDPALQEELTAIKEQLKVVQAKLQSAESQEAVETGSTFVRWGRTECPKKYQTVYSGVAGGSFFTHTGAAANALCLTMTPQFDSEPKPKIYSELYGAEYEHIPGLDDVNVPCAVCRVAQSTTIMMAAALTCPSGWTPQYTGHLAAGHPKHKAATEYLCMDGQLEAVNSSQANDNGFLLYYTVAQCGSLPCGPYIQDKVITCVVCSK